MFGARNDERPTARRIRYREEEEEEEEEEEGVQETLESEPYHRMPPNKVAARFLGIPWNPYRPRL